MLAYIHCFIAGKGMLAILLPTTVFLCSLFRSAVCYTMDLKEIETSALLERK